MKKLLCLLAALTGLASEVSAEQTKLIYNPFTGKLDYITRVDSTTAGSPLAIYSGSTLVSSPTTSIILSSTNFTTTGAGNDATIELGPSIVISTATVRSSIVFSTATSILRYYDGVPFLSVPDNGSMYFGYDAGGANPNEGVPGVSNTMFGYQAGNSLTTGVLNLGFGAESLENLTTGVSNTCIGAASCQLLTTGSTNTGIGPNSLANLTTGVGNVAMGPAALALATTGSFNTCVGNAACVFTTTARNNTAYGGFALQRLVSSGENSAFGNRALVHQVEGLGNTAIGYEAGVGTTTAGALLESVNTNVKGNRNIYIGNQTGQSVSSATAINSSIAIGYQALLDASNQAQIGGRSGTGNEVNLRVSSITIEGLNTGQCLQTGTGGLVTGTGAACGSGSGGVVLVTSATLGSYAVAYSSAGSAIGPDPYIQFSSVTTGLGGPGLAEMKIRTQASYGFIVEAASGTSSIGSFALHGTAVSSGTGQAYGVFGSASGSGTNTGGLFIASGGTSNLAIHGIGNSLNVGSMTITNGLAVSTISVTSSGAGEIDLTEGIAPAPVADTDILWGDSTDSWLKFIPDGTTDYLVVGSSASATVGNCAKFSANGSIVDAGGACGTGAGTPGTPINAVQYNSAGAFAGNTAFNFSGSSLTVNTAVRVSTLTVITPVTASSINGGGLLDVFAGNLIAGSTTVLLNVGTNQQEAQFIVANEQPVNMSRYGADIGELRVGRLTNTQKIYSNQATTQALDIWNSGNMELKSASAANGGKSIAFYPRQVETLRLNETGATFSSSATFTQAVLHSSNTIMPGATFYHNAPILMGGTGSVTSLFINGGNATGTGGTNLVIGVPGGNAGRNLVSGNGNTCLGSTACNSMWSDTSMTAVGSGAGIASSGTTSNTWIGALSGNGTTTGSSNAGVGRATIYSNVTGSNLSALGWNACSQIGVTGATALSAATCIGAESYIEASNTMAIGSPNYPITDVYMNSKAPLSGNTAGSSTVFHAQSSTGTNTAGGNLTLAGGQGTGTGAGGDVRVQVSSASVTSGSQVSPLTTIATFAYPGIGLMTRTVVQIAAIAPKLAGQLVYCSDCTALRVCVSTGTVVGAWSSPVAATTACQ